MQFRDAGILRCVECGLSLVLDGSARLHCDNDHGYEIRDGIIDLRPPLASDDHRLEEEQEFADGSPEAERTKRAPWLWISRFPQVERFDKQYLPIFGSGRFLEIGGGSCYVSAMVKSTYPDSTVYATDVAVNTLKNKARPVCALFPRQPDYFLACAAEMLPFNDGTIDYIYGELFMHHSDDPSSILRECRRVLAPNGRMIILEPAVPPHFAWLFRERATHRESALHIHEALIPYEAWQRAAIRAGLPGDTVKINTDSKYVGNPAF